MRVFNIFRQCMGQEPTRPPTHAAAPRPDNRTDGLPGPTRPPARISPQIWKLLVCGRRSKEDRLPVADTDSDQASRASSDAAGAIPADGFQLPRFSFEDAADSNTNGADNANNADGSNNAGDAGNRNSVAVADSTSRIPANKFGLPVFSFEKEKTGKTGDAGFFDDLFTDSTRESAFRHPLLAERKYLTRYELQKLMPWGRDAEKRSGLVLSHIDALKDVAAGLDTALAFRKVNPAAQYWIQKNFPVKGLNVKSKSEKGGPLQGLLVATQGRKGGTVAAIDARTLGLKLEGMISTHSLEVIENTAEEDADPKHYVLKVHDPEKKTTYKMKFNVEESTFSVFKFDGKDYQPMTFRGVQGQPLTADYDAFDFYPRLKSKNFVGFKDIDTSALARPKPRFADLVEIAMKDVLELPEVRQTTEGLGRLNGWDAHVIKACNDEIRKQSGYPHDVLMHGKEKRNTQYPELCNEVFFVFPDGQTLMSTSWEQTQAVDYAIKQEGFVSTDNRVYNIPAGSQVLFHDQRTRDGSEAIPPGSGKRIDWDSRAAAEKLYGDYSKSASTGSNAKAGIAGQTPQAPGLTGFHRRSAASLRSIESASSVASAQNVPAWLSSLVGGTSADPSTGTDVRRGSSGSNAEGSSAIQRQLLGAIRERSEHDQGGIQE